MNEIQDIKNKYGQEAETIISNGLNLQKVGKKYRCPNNLAHKHGDKNPSLSWDLSALHYHCFTCNTNIDLYGYYREYLNYTHQEVIAELMGKDNVSDTSMAKSRNIFQDQTKELTPILDNELEYLKLRKLTVETIQAFNLQNYKGSIAFPYYKNNVMIGCKTRKPEKHIEGSKYLSLSGSKPGLFNYDNTNTEEDLIICEGEIDCMIIYQSGYKNVVSIGAGANSVKMVAENYKYFLDKFSSIILFSDNDDAGSSMDNAFLEVYPNKVRLIDKGGMHSKDANEEYFKNGAESIAKIIISAAEKVEGFFDPYTDAISIQELFDKGKFVPTGLPSIDNAINDLAPGCVTLVAGRSNDGKSTFINQVIANAINSNVKVLLMSGEDDKRIIINRIYQIVIGKDPGLYDSILINKRYIKIPKASTLLKLKEWHKDKLHMFMKGESSLKTTDELFSMVSRKIKTGKYNLIVIDNLMSILSIRTEKNKNEDQADFIQRCCDFAKMSHCHIVVVLHPNKTYQKGEKMVFEQISGTSDMANKVDNVISIVREYDEIEKNKGINGYCEVIKNRHFTELTTVPLNYDVDTGLLLEVNKITGKKYNYEFHIEKYMDVSTSKNENQEWWEGL